MAVLPSTSVLFVCVHNAGRSQMAAAWLRHLSHGRIEVCSAGTLPTEHVNPQAVRAMAEIGIDLLGPSPRVLTPDMVKSSDYVITMGCGDTCPVFPGKQYRDWALQDPAGQDIDVVRGIRDEIRDCVTGLIAEIDRNRDVSAARVIDAA
ncbi:arsenate reductase ArsC [Streptomyces sp. RB110-1]|uniref:arsenate reductase ArsC n=1 Tax=unclassified Streptomyces TaxID=2593676 RepID=UPI001902430E|nr:MULTISPECIES: arsenate reductase ArsC [unclassified Streptomyces]MBK0372967.1 arsenate reductase ArsC [Streptomyces sp. RB110-1]MBK0390665.1 arsenate reductase ArsC [Streptomyces sp. RB110-2]